MGLELSFSRRDEAWVRATLSKDRRKHALIINRGAFYRRNDLARRGRSPSQGRSPRHSHGC